jgi:hypothetical protein
VVSNHTGPEGASAYERPLIQSQRNKGLGIFACDASALYDAPLAKKGAWLSFANIGIFIEIWDEVKKTGIYKEHQWTVKVDPDAVFLPQRLRQHLTRLRVPPRQALYVENCNFKFRFMGALEILSTEAVHTFFAQKHECDKFISHDGGEDSWMHACLDAIGVPHMSDYSLLNDKYILGKYDEHDVSACASPDAVAFHPYKDEDLWMQCHAMTDTKQRFLQK